MVFLFQQFMDDKLVKNTNDYADVKYIVLTSFSLLDIGVVVTVLFQQLRSGISQKIEKSREKNCLKEVQKEKGKKNEDDRLN